jgi:hypothetical protein
LFKDWSFKDWAFELKGAGHIFESKSGPMHRRAHAGYAIPGSGRSHLNRNFFQLGK